MNIGNEIKITDIDGFQIGNAENVEAGTGCTVIHAINGATTAVDIRGGAPASRECGLLNPLAANDNVNAVVLSGGSAFGLAASDGVMKYLEEKNIGFPTANGVVPIVCSSCLFDLGVGSSSIRPDNQMGYQACLNFGNYQDGNYGAGTGASVGKIIGMEHSMKSGIGSFAWQINDLQVGAIVAVNAVGNIINPINGKTIAGIHDGNTFMDAEELLYSLYHEQTQLQHTNTTIGAIITNAHFNKTQLTKIAGMAHDGFARCIRPIHTMYDGDSIYAMSNGSINADINLVGTLSVWVMEKAIINAITSSTSAYGLDAYSDITE